MLNQLVHRTGAVIVANQYFQTYTKAPRVQDVGNAAEGPGSFSDAFKIAALNHPDRRILNWP